MLPAFFKAAQNSHSPLMIQISTGTAEYLGYRLLVDAVRSLAESENVPTCLHLDHCSDISAIETAMNAGFSSVMYDGSHLGWRKISVIRGLWWKWRARGILR
jgi:fructose-bisphosphate aldolase class II